MSDAPSGVGRTHPGNGRPWTRDHVGSAAVLAGAFAVGPFSGLTSIQSAYAAIPLGWVTGLAIGRSRSDTPAAPGAGIIALAGSATASVIALTG